MTGKPKTQMKTKQINRLCQLESEMIFQAPRSMYSATDVVVEADGIGGAKLLIVEGNYPADYTTHKEQSFETEDEACEAAEQLIAPIKTSRLPN